MLPGLDTGESAESGAGRRLALARKYRPAKFAEIVGQEHVVSALESSLRAGRLHHAYLLTGTRGIGKTTVARILAKAFNCERGGDGAVAEPCGECTQCTEITAGCCSDVIELDAASHTQVDRMRELLETAHYSPVSARYKVYVIDEVHMLSKHAFNAMLKTLEEPPEHAKFILATTDPQMVPATVQSRCLRFMLRRLEPGLIREQLAKILGHEGVGIEDGALAVIAELADGSLRDALSILDEAISSGDTVKESYVRRLAGLADAEMIPNLLDALAADDAGEIRAVCDKMYEQASSYDNALAQFAGMLHRAALAQKVPSLAESHKADKAAEAVKKAAETYSDGALQAFYEIALHARDTLRFAPEPRVGFEMALLRMMVIARAGAELASGGDPPTEKAADGAGGTDADDHCGGGGDPPTEKAADGALPARHRQPPPQRSRDLPADAAQWRELVAGFDARVSTLLDECAFVSAADGVIQVDPGRSRARIEKNLHLLEQSLRSSLTACSALKLVDVGSVGETPEKSELREHNKRLELDRREKLASSEHAMITGAFPDSVVGKKDVRGR